MRRIIALAFLLLLASGVLGATVFNGQIAGASGKRTAKPAAPSPPSPSSVLVVNPSNQPVPVSGNVNVGTLPSVKLDPTGNTVQLAAGSAVKTTGTDNPALQPVNAEQAASWTDGTAGAQTPVLYTVPAGKELVIEQVTISTSLPNGEDLSGVDLETYNTNTQYQLNVSHEAPATSSHTRIFGSTVTRIYAAAGDSVVCDFFRYPTTESPFAQCSISGHLVDVP